MTLMRVMAAVTALLPLCVFHAVVGSDVGVLHRVRHYVRGHDYRVGEISGRIAHKSAHNMLLAICAISICFSLHWRQFMAWQRLGAFILLLFAVGPVVQTRFISRMKRRALGYIGWICVLCALYYNGLYVFMIVHYCSWLSPYSWVFDYSMSISMLFGALSAIGSIYTAWLLLSLRWKGTTTRAY